jgi:hypothetical protein
MIPICDLALSEQCAAFHQNSCLSQSIFWPLDNIELYSIMPPFVHVDTDPSSIDLNLKIMLIYNKQHPLHLIR